MTLPSHENQTMLDTLIKSLLEEGTNRDQDYERMLDLVHKSSPITLTPWLRRTGWTKTFEGRDMKELVDLARKPKDGEPGLLLIWNAIERVVQKCFDGVKDCWNRGWGLILFWLMSTKRSEDSSKPFRMHFKDGTVSRYASYWQQFFMFCLRSLEDPNKYGVEFRGTQLNGLNELQVMVDLEQPSNDELDKKVMSITNNTDELILELSINFIKHADYVKERSVLLYFLGTLGYDSINKQWLKPSIFE